MRRVLLLASAFLAASACLVAVTACGLITAGVSVPEAFTHNNNLGLKGTIRDDQGNPVDDVVVTVKREYYLWHADRSYPEFDTLTLMANHTFDIPSRRAHELTFTFRKPGYLDQTLTVAQNYIKGENRWLEGDQWPLDTAVQVVLLAKDRPIPALRWLALQVDFTDPTKNPVIDLTKALPTSADPSLGYSREHTVMMSGNALTVLPGGEGAWIAPPLALYASIERQPTKTTGPEHRVDSLDLNMPARLRLRINDADAGFAVFIPGAGTHPLAQMTLAPENAYLPEFTLSEARLRQLRNPASNLISERNEFFYFRANGKYGKGVISWAHTSDETGPLRLFLALMIQPDGTRNLTTRSMP